MTKCVVAISGKRKTGKDFCTRILKRELQNRHVDLAVTGISHSLKMEYAKMHELDFSELLTDGPYKEQYRKDMIKWGENVRNKDSSVFCRAAMEPLNNIDVVIVSDCRRPTDYAFFTTNYRTITVRVETSEEERLQRGFQFVEGVDDCDSECGLDNYEFDVILKNLTDEDITPQIESIISRVLELINKI